MLPASADAAAWFGGSDFHLREDRRRAVERARRPLTTVVAAALQTQNARYAPSPARDRNLAALGAGAAAVVTGQQVGLFLGPLFNLYKAASAIRCAAALQQETGEPVVPVFWLQSEDHDLPEIAVHHTLAAGGVPLSLHLATDPADRRSVAHRVLPDEVRTRLTDLRMGLESLPHAAAHLDRLDRHYVPGTSWPTAFAGVLAELFAEEGLVLIDPRDDAFAAAQIAVHERALGAARAIAANLVARVDALRAVGRPTPVHVRRDAPLSFFHPQGPSGPRYRLEPDGSALHEVGGDGRHTATALAARLRAEPLSFSTSALLRPILQDTLLPTAAYVGGATEVAYFAQIAPLYEEFALPMPLVVPRASFRFVDARSARTLQRWQLRTAECEDSRDAVLRRAATIADDSEEALLRLLLTPFERRLEELAPKLVAVDSDLHTAIEKTRATVAMAVSKLGSRYDRACRRRNQRLVDDVALLTTLFHPEAQPQERYYGFSAVAARLGERAFLALVLAAVDPFAGGQAQNLCAPGEVPA